MIKNSLRFINRTLAAKTLFILCSCTAIESHYSTTAPASQKQEIAHENSQPAAKKEEIAQAPEPALPPTDVWQVLREGFSLDTHTEHRSVKSQLHFYAQHQSYLNRVSKRAEPFLYYITKRLEEKGLPLELALLPVVESAFDPFAYSHGRASGLWQFIPSTGKYYGLEQTWWYDARRDPIAATEAALTYLEKLNKRFKGDWELAIAAYNAGGGRVNRAVTKNRDAGKPTDFWSLDLPAETRAYVPKLLALSELVRHPEKHGVKLPTINNVPYLARIEPKVQVDIKTAAELAGLSESEFRALNAGYTKWATAPSNFQSINLPIDRVESFEQGLSNLSDSQRMKFERYQIKSGDALARIARKHNTHVDAIRAYNDISGSGIIAGDYLLIPIPAAPLEYYKSSDWQRLAKAQNRGGKNGAFRVEHQVERGDSLWSVARKHKVTIRDITRWNKMAPADPIRPGQTLVLWQKQKMGSATRKVHYSVRSGDSLARIAQKFKVTVNELQRWNQSLGKSKYLQPGDRVTIFVDTNNQH